MWNIKRNILLILLIVFLVFFSGCSTNREQELFAGLRASSYGIKPFPSPQWWVDSSTSMSSWIDGSQPSVIWIVGIMADSSHMWLSMPKDSEVDDPYILFTNDDSNEVYLDLFDEMGVKVWLQVEPGEADVSTLIDIVLSQYSAHSCVIGFGVDVEWYRQSEDYEGVAITDAEAQAWSEQVRSYNPDYLLFLKHWLPEKMPSTYREGLVFVNDRQRFESLDHLMADFESWGQTFAPTPVSFQFGYLSDQSWWSQLEDPPAAIGLALVERVPNLHGIYWVDFTAGEIWPNEW
jgi:hypothetical protein